MSPRPARVALVLVLALWAGVGLWRESALRHLHHAYEEVVVARPELEGYAFVYREPDPAKRLWLDVGYGLGRVRAWALYGAFALATVALVVPEVRRRQRGSKRSTPCR